MCGTKSGHFLRVRFSNIRGYSEQWITVELAPSAKLLPEGLPAANLRPMKMVLMKRFVHAMFKDLMFESYSGSVVNGQVYPQRIAIYIVYKP